MVIHNEESLPSTQTVCLQELNQLAFHTDKHSNVLSWTDENSSDLDDSTRASLTAKPCGNSCRFYEKRCSKKPNRAQQEILELSHTHTHIYRT